MDMTLLGIHVIIATFGIIGSILNIFKPSKVLILTTYFLTFGTIVSGIMISIFNHTLLNQTCISGLVYLTFITSSLKIAKLREFRGN